MSVTPYDLFAMNAREAERSALAMLRELEWGDHDSAGDRRCPSCGEAGPWADVEGHEHKGMHTPDCRLATLLKDGDR